MAEPTLYLFDGYNLLHAGGFADVRENVDEVMLEIQNGDFPNAT